MDAPFEALYSGKDRGVAKEILAAVLVRWGAGAPDIRRALRDCIPHKGRVVVLAALESCHQSALHGWWRVRGPGEVWDLSVSRAPGAGPRGSRSVNTRLLREPPAPPTQKPGVYRELRRRKPVGPPREWRPPRGSGVSLVHVGCSIPERGELCCAYVDTKEGRATYFRAPAPMRGWQLRGCRPRAAFVDDCWSDAVRWRGRRLPDWWQRYRGRTHQVGSLSALLEQTGSFRRLRRHPPKHLWNEVWVEAADIGAVRPVKLRTDSRGRPVVRPVGPWLSPEDWRRRLF